MIRASRSSMVLGTGLLLGILALTARVEWSSVERANRLFRAERHSDAAALYRARLQAADPGSRALLRYNLGTTLLHLDDPGGAEVELTAAVETADSAVAFRSHYNLGRHMLTGAVTHPSPDSAEIFARRATELNRQALRLDPTSDDARWNLALSQRALDSLLWLQEGVREEEVRDSLRSGRDVASPALLREIQDEAGTLGGQFFTRGEREALARDLARSPLTEAEANSFLAGFDQRPQAILRRLFLVESENRWGNLGGSDRPGW